VSELLLDWKGLFTKPEAFLEELHILNRWLNIIPRLYTGKGDKAEYSADYLIFWWKVNPQEKKTLIKANI
jgi:hypothetical protein